jgi:hypothetical protein
MPWAVDGRHDPGVGRGRPGKTSVLSVLNDALEGPDARGVDGERRRSEGRRRGRYPDEPSPARCASGPKVPALFDVVVIDEASFADVRSIHVVAGTASATAGR